MDAGDGSDQRSHGHLVPDLSWSPRFGSVAGPGMPGSVRAADQNSSTVNCLPGESLMAVSAPAIAAANCSLPRSLRSPRAQPGGRARGPPPLSSDIPVRRHHRAPGTLSSTDGTQPGDRCTPARCSCRRKTPPTSRLAPDNPGLRRLPCHVRIHGNFGMDRMVVYPNISTPYTVGMQPENFWD
jgi:hypothetical protein